MKYKVDFLRNICCTVILLLGFSSAIASHLYGGDLYYTYLSGNKYKVTMVLYGDCAGSASAFSALYAATPQVEVYNGSTLFRTMSLKVLAGAGTEVTPVCATSLGSTTCNGGTVPGVRRFQYEDTITLAPSAAWKMRSNGYLTGATIAGRSGSITNISASGSSIMSLEATLNNSSQTNSNPTFSTIPTPFFCINVVQEYNPGAVETDLGDSLVYTLVNGLDATTTPSSLVTYLSGYSATSPLACATGSFTFNSSSGQLTFNPNLAQVSLVVYKVTEYRSGVIVGTCMREMNFIVLASCSNRSPYGKISSVSGGKAINNTEVNVCKNSSFVSFNINPVDSDGNNIMVTVAGLPSGATLSITGSGTTSPSTSFYWDITTVSPGTYYFYLTYQDDACPLSSKQTVVYTIVVLPKPTFTSTIISTATCSKKAVFDVVTGFSGTWVLKAYKGATLLHSITSTSSTQRDSLAVGSYTLNVTNSNGCYENATINILPPPSVILDSCTVTMPLCNGGADGRLYVRASGGFAPYLYQINGSAFSSTSLFTGLSAGTYSITIRDANNCTKDTLIALAEPSPIIITVGIKKPFCNAAADGIATIMATGGTGSYSYAMGTSGAFGASNIFASLAAGTYTFRVKDANDCLQNISVIVSDSIVVSSIVVTQNVSCFAGVDGSITLSPYIGKLPFTYALGSGSFGTSAVFASLGAGTYSLRVKDSFGCIGTVTANITQPTKLKLAMSVTKPSCNGYTDGILTAIGSGGTAPYLFSFDSKPFAAVSTISSLAAGLYNITIKDNKGCTTDTAVMMTEPKALKLSTTITIPLCNGNSNGKVLVMATGGTAPFVYSYNSSLEQSDSMFENLKSGSYLIKIKDNNGCQKDTNIIITEPSKLAIKLLDIINPTCENYADGTIKVLAQNATPPYAYAINTANFGVNNVFEKLKESSYLIRVKDSNNCILDTNVALVGYPKIKLDSTIIIATRCFGTNEGSITFFASGGNPPLRYLFETEKDTSANIFYANLQSGTYVITVADKTNCFKSFSAFVPRPEHIIIDKTITHNDCTGLDTNGKIIALVKGGTAPYLYRWSLENKTDESISGLANGNYFLWVADANNCTDSISTEIFYDNCCTPAIPNAFTPNNDGRNDVFRIIYKGDVELKELSIYNRYGQQVFKTNNINQAWDGTFNNQQAELGVYYYMLKMICGNLKNKEVFLKGDVTLIR